MLKKILNTKTYNSTVSAAIIGGATLFIKIFGLIRDKLISQNFGATSDTDIYFAAFRIPDFLFNFLIVGGLAVVFLPIFSDFMKKSEESAWEMANNVLNIFLLLIFILSLTAFIFAPFFLNLIFPGFNGIEMNTLINLTRILLLSTIFFTFSSFFSSILIYFNRFLVYSIAPLLYNLFIIIAIIFFAKDYGIFAPAVGAVVGSFFHFFIQYFIARDCGYKYKLMFDIKKREIKKIFTLIIPRTIAMAGTQINELFITGIASTLTTGSIAIYNYANNIRGIPIGFLGIPYAVSMFPVLSKAWSDDDKKKFSKELTSAIRQILFLVIPLSALIFILRAGIVEMIFNTLDFSSKTLTSTSVGIFAIGSIAATLIPLLSRAFFSTKDTKTPTIISISAVVINITLIYFFIGKLNPLASNIFKDFLTHIFDLSLVSDISVLAIPTAFVISLILNAVLMMVFLNKKAEKLINKENTSFFLKLIANSFLLLFVSNYILKYLNRHYSFTGFFMIFIKLSIISTISLVIYFTISYLLKIKELNKIIEFIKRKWK